MAVEMAAANKTIASLRMDRLYMVWLAGVLYPRNILGAGYARARKRR
jgi:hypothetical protein